MANCNFQWANPWYSVPLQFEFQSRSDRFIGITRLVQLLNKCICTTRTTFTAAALYIRLQIWRKLRFTRWRKCSLSVSMKRMRVHAFIVYYLCTVVLTYYYLLTRFNSLGSIEDKLWRCTGYEINCQPQFPVIRLRFRFDAWNRNRGSLQLDIRPL